MKERKFRLHGWFSKGNMGDNLTREIFCARLEKEYGKGCVLPVSSQDKLGGIPILAGGGCLDRGKATEFSMALFFKESPKYLVGVGVNPILSPEDISLIKSRMGDNYLMTVRDFKSRLFAERAGLRPCAVTSDVCWLHKEAQRGEVNSKKAGIIVTRYSFCEEAEYVVFYKSIAQFLRTKGFSIKWLPFGEADLDRELISKLKEPKDEVVSLDEGKQLDCDGYFKELLDLEFVVNTRLHGLIYATLAHCPSFTFSYSYKVESLVESLGMTNNFVALQFPPYSEGVSLSGALQVFYEKFEESRALDVTTVLKIKELKEQAELNFVLLFNSIKYWEWNNAYISKYI